MFKVEAYFEGKLISCITYECKTSEEAKISMINSLYWNVISCSDASQPKWWEKFEYKITPDFEAAYKEMRRATGTENKESLLDFLSRKTGADFSDQKL